MLVLARSQTDFKIMASTLDSSIGLGVFKIVFGKMRLMCFLRDCFDKISRLLGCTWASGTNQSPGAALEYLASQHQGSLLDLPHNVLPGQLLFSYSGLRSAVERYYRDHQKGNKAQVAASFQHAAVAQIERKVTLVLDQLKEERVSALVCSGGVASNQFLRRRLRETLDDQGNNNIRLLFPPVHLCTDNAAMIAFVGSERLKRCSVDASYEHNFLPKW